MKELVEGVLAEGSLTVADTASPADIFVVCVPTPISADKTANLKMVKAAMAATAPSVKAGNLVILESTSPIGTTKNVIGGALEAVGLDPEKDVDVCYCPERVFPGDTIREILENDRIIGGLTSKAAVRAQKFYSSFCRGEAVLTHATAGEFSKLMENTYRDVNIALANAFARIAENTDADVREVIKLANMHPRVNVHTPGPGVGGHCIPVDPWFLIEAFPEDTALLHQSRTINDTQAARLIDRAEADGGLDKGDTVAILGAAYRGDIDDARDTPTELLIGELSKRGYKWRTHDPLVQHFHLHNGCEPHLTSSMDAALEGAKAVFIMTAHTDYKSLTQDDFSSLAQGVCVIDGPAILNEAEFTDRQLIITGKRT